MTTFGVEEEFIFLDRDTLSPVNVGEDVQHSLLGGAQRSKFISHEFLASQIERSSPVFSSLDQAEADLVAFRSRLAAEANSRGVLAAATGAPFQAPAFPRITDSQRYRTVETEFRGLVTDHLINGLHIHVGVADRDIGVRVLNRIRVWLPSVLALAGNSPFWRGTDTGFASWRSIHMRRWSTIGCPPVFLDAEDYGRRTRALVDVGGTYDIKTVWWIARLSEEHPTVELRVSDAQLDLHSTLLLAALSRALVATAVRDAERGIPPTDLAPELLDAALWHAARDGLSERLLHPLTGTLAPADEVVAALFAHVADALDDEGDAAWADTLLQRLRAEGTGAERQRGALAAGGTEGLLELFSASLVAH